MDDALLASMAVHGDLEHRVLFLPPTARDGEVIEQLLTAVGIACARCTSVTQSCREIGRGAGAVIWSEEALVDGVDELSACVECQPVWSDLPVIVLARPGTESPKLSSAVDRVGNVTVVERPVRVGTLLSVLRTAIRARTRQYDVRARLAELAETGRALRESEQRFRNLSESIPLIVSTSDAEGNVDYVNRAWTEFSGQPAEAFINSPWAQAIHPDDREAVAALWAKALTTGLPYEYEFRATGRGGQRALIARGMPTRDVTGKLVSWVNCALDITQRRQQEANLAFLSEISQDLVRWADAGDAMNALGAKIGAYFNLSACLFIENDVLTNTCKVDHGWSRADVPFPSGVYRIDDFVSTEFQRTAQAGETIVVRDASIDPRTDSEKHAALRIGSFVALPFVRNGEWLFTLGFHRSVVADWREDEVELMRELAARIWTRLERARAEDALRESEKRYRTLFESMDEGYCIIEVLFDPSDASRAIDYRFVEVNPAFENQSGMHGVVGRRMLEFVPEIEMHWLENYSRVALTGEPFRFANFFKGLYRWFDVYAFRVGPAEARLVAVLFTDITERKQTESALAMSEQRLRQAKEAAGLGIHEYDIVSGTLRWDERVRSLWGVGPDETITYDLFLSCLHPHDHASVQAAVARALDPTSDGLYVAEYRVTSRMDGRTRWVAATGNVTFELGKAVRLIGTTQDITERKWAEQELTKHRENLQALVNERTLELEKSHHQLRLSERMAALGTLSAGLGHDMGNVLVPVRVRLESLAKADLPEASRQDVQAIQSSAEYLRKLASGLRMLALDPQNRGSGEVTEVQSWWEEAESLLRNALPRGVALKSSIEPGQIRVSIGRPALTQVVFNLVQNAGDAMRSQGTGTVTIEIEGSQVIAPCRDESQSWAA